MKLSLGRKGGGKAFLIFYFSLSYSVINLPFFTHVKSVLPVTITGEQSSSPFLDPQAFSFNFLSLFS